MKLVLQSPDGTERVCTDSANGYDGWVQLERRKSNPPEFADWVDGSGFVVNEALREGTLEEARLRTLTRKQMKEEMEQKFLADMQSQPK